MVSEAHLLLAERRVHGPASSVRSWYQSILEMEVNTWTGLGQHKSSATSTQTICAGRQCYRSSVKVMLAPAVNIPWSPPNQANARVREVLNLERLLHRAGVTL